VAHLSSGGWRKAAASGIDGCVEVGAYDGCVLIRHSKDPALQPLTFTRAEFAAFLNGARNGEFDDLCASSGPRPCSP
jgi:hypothetical protein